MIRWLEANGYNVSYSTDVDSARRGAEILEHQVFLSVGHDEYWSGEQRANVEAARDAGVHLAFFSGNEMYWKTRWENSIDSSGTAVPHAGLLQGVEGRRRRRPDQHLDRHLARQPLHPAGRHRPARATPDGTDLVGQPRPRRRFRHRHQGARGGREAAVLAEHDGRHPFPGQTATLANGTLGYEWDEDVDNGFRPGRA